MSQNSSLATSLFGSVAGGIILAEAPIPVPRELCATSSNALRMFIRLMEGGRWYDESSKVRSHRRLRIAALGTKDAFDQQAFANELTSLFIRKLLVWVLRTDAERANRPSKAILSTAMRCEKEGSEGAARAAFRALETESDASRYTPAVWTAKHASESAYFVAEGTRRWRWIGQ